MFRAIHDLSLNGLPFVFAALGVKLYVDFDSEDCYMEVSIDHDPGALRIVLDAIERLGLEVVPDDECEWEVRDGVTKCILAEARHAGEIRVVA